jgi:arylsulfatase A-like enzyme
VIAALLLAGVACETPDRSARDQPPNIVLILVDTLRADHLGFAGYERPTSPAIDRLAAENLVFENAIAPAPWTPPSVASIFTGLYPTAHGVQAHLYDEEREGPEAPPMRGEILADELPTLAEVLQDHGYQTMAIVTNPWVADYLGFAQGFAHYWQFDDGPARSVTAGARSLLNKAQSGSEPFFLYLHYMDPHVPYDPPPQFAGTFRGRLAGYEDLPDEEADRFNRYDEEILSVDAAIADLVRHLRDSGLYDDLVLVFIADHGEQFFERGERGHGYTLHAEEVRVPMIVRAGGRRGSVGTAVSLIDLYPTILRLAGVAKPPPGQGHSLFEALDRREAEGVVTEMTRWQNAKAYVRHDGYKLILRFDADYTALVSPETGLRGDALYDTRKDPFERSSLSDRVLAQELEAAFWKVYSESARRRATLGVETAPLTDETIEKLRSLGYVQ